MNTLTSDSGLTAINVNKVRSSMDSYYETNEMTITIESKEKSKAGKETGKIIKKQTTPLCRSFPQIYIAACIETILTTIFEAALKEAPVNKKEKTEINRHCVKRVIKKNKYLKNLFYTAMTLYDKSQSYDNVTVITFSNMEKLLDENTVLSKKCRFFIRYLVGYYFDRMADGCFACITANGRKSVTSSDAENVARILLTGSLLTKCCENAKAAVEKATGAAAQRAKDKAEGVDVPKAKKSKGPAKAKPGKKAPAKKAAKKVKKDDDEDGNNEDEEVVANDEDEAEAENADGEEEEAEAPKKKPAKKAPAKKTPVKRA